MRRLRVAIFADYLEEQWPSMDLVADMLLDRLQREHIRGIDAVLVRPALRRRAAAWLSSPRAHTLDRLANRLWDYPRVAGAMTNGFDVFHVVDHSYSQLVHRLPAGRTVVTCHDLDTFRSVLEPGAEPRSWPFRRMTRHILAGLRKAGHVTADSEATRAALIGKAGIPAERTTVVPNGPHPSCRPDPDAASDLEAARLLGAAGRTIDLLHVGSTIARKRLDLVLAIFAAVRREYPSARLVRVGGPFTAEQRGLARALGVADSVVVLPVLDRSTLAAVYRRSALVLLPSDREGFGLPVLESLACGTPVVASDIPPLREVGGYAVSYCAPGHADVWRAMVARLLKERASDPTRWKFRREAAVRRAAAFSWSRYAAEVAAIYTRVAGVSGSAPPAAVPAGPTA
jgi:glycosyltransferase involved in cell wall biosynthesis